MNRGSGPLTWTVHRCGLAFNEAPIHESGKFDATYRLMGISAVPSMRPRFMNRGSAFGCSERILLESAFNEAPIHESGKS